MNLSVTWAHRTTADISADRAISCARQDLRPVSRYCNPVGRGEMLVPKSPSRSIRGQFSGITIRDPKPYIVFGEIDR